MLMAKKSTKVLLRDMAEELDTFDTMLSSLVEILEQKGILTQEEWEKKIKDKIDKSKDQPSYRDIQFSE